MGDRYIIQVTCPRCDYIDWDVLYAPQSGFTHYTCSECGYIVDLEEYTGISKESCSNKDLIQGIVDEMSKLPESHESNENR